MLPGNRIRLTPVLTSIFVGFVIANLASNVGGETWTDLRGENSIEAKFIGLWEGRVILELPDGRRKSIALDKLRSDSMIQANNLAKKNDAARAARINDLREQAASLTAAAPIKQVSPPPAPAYTPPKKDASIGEFVKQVNDALTGGHLRVLYDFRPPSYRKDISDVIKLAANKTSPESFQKITNVSYRMGDLIVTRRNWLFSSPRFGNFEPAERDKAKWTLLGLANVLQKGLGPDALPLETLQSKDFNQWLDQWDQIVAPHVAEMVKKADLNFDSYTSVISEGEGTATISTGMGDTKAQVDLVLVEGFWVSKTAADSWSDNVATAKQKIGAITDGKFMESETVMAGIVGATFESVASAKTADQYHDALDAVLTQADSTASFQQILGALLSPIETIIAASSGSAGAPGADAADAADGSAQQ